MAFAVDLRKEIGIHTRTRKLVSQIHCVDQQKNCMAWKWHLHKLSNALPHYWQQTFFTCETLLMWSQLDLTFFLNKSCWAENLLFKKPLHFWDKVSLLLLFVQSSTGVSASCSAVRGVQCRTVIPPCPPRPQSSSSTVESTVTLLPAPLTSPPASTTTTTALRPQRGPTLQRSPPNLSRPSSPAVTTSNIT